jgi:hypothetical protein
METPLGFWEKIDTSAGDAGCWLWLRARTRGGYGELKVGGHVRYAHRVAYELFKGDIPTGLTIDHLCRNRGCVNPAHMEAVTNRENTFRGMRGHPFDEENTRIVIPKHGRKVRECRVCRRGLEAARRARRRAKRQAVSS